MKSTYDWLGTRLATEADLAWAFHRYDEKHPSLADYRFVLTDDMDSTVVAVRIVQTEDAANGLWSLAEIRADMKGRGPDPTEECDRVAALMLAEIAKEVQD